MDHSEIAPLAKRLAEENNVDWRRLTGSGEGGQVVERDVLEYLARVMAGEEALDPTPEPVPEGMAAWPEADVRAGAATPASVDPTSTIEDDIFIFDDVVDEPPAAAAASSAAAAGEPLWDDDGEDILDVSDPVEPSTPVAASGWDREPVRIDELPAASAAAPVEPSPPSGESASWFSAPSAGPDLDVGSEADDDMVPLPERGGIRELPDLFLDDAGEVEPDRGASEAPPPVFDGVVFGEADEGVTEAPLRTAAPLDVPSLDGPALDAPSFDEPSLDTPSLEPQPFDAPSLDAAAADGPSLDAPAPDPEPDPAPVPEPDTEPAPAPEHETTPTSVEAPAATAAPVAPPVAEPVERSASGALPLLRHPHVWRRQIDLTALVAAQADLAAELGHDEPIAIDAFLVRAAAKALAVDAGPGSVALARVEAASVRSVVIDASGDFAATVAALEHAEQHGSDGALSGVSLLVADLSELGIDDAVLDAEVPVVSLGRVLIDNQSGARRAYLTLSGDSAGGGDAARLLARVADLLERPVRLVL